LPAELIERLAAILGAAPELEPVGGGHGATLYRARTRHGAFAVKNAPRLLSSEGRMLRDLAGKLPLAVPHVHFADDTLLVSDWIDSDGSALDIKGQEQLAEAMLALHANSADRFGYGYDVMIGGMPQINEWQPDWRTLFRDKRLLGAGFLAQRAGRLPNEVYDRLLAFCARFDHLIDEPQRPALLHGDFWSGNLLTLKGRPVGLIDPAIYFGHPEMDVAFSNLFGGMGQRFVTAYATAAGLAPGWRERLALWNLWPLLVHVYLFGGAYVDAVDRVLQRYTRSAKLSG
jgi:fructosamine-3-kinase